MPARLWEVPPPDLQTQSQLCDEKSAPGCLQDCFTECNCLCLLLHMHRKGLTNTPPSPWHHRLQVASGCPKHKLPTSLYLVSGDGFVGDQDTTATLNMQTLKTATPRSAWEQEGGGAPILHHHWHPMVRCQGVSQLDCTYCHHPNTPPSPPLLPFDQHALVSKFYLRFDRQGLPAPLTIHGLQCMLPKTCKKCASKYK